MNVAIQDIGVVFSGGAGMDMLEKKLTEGWNRPKMTDIPFYGCKKPVHLVDQSIYLNSRFKKKLRRVNSITKMAVLASTQIFSEEASSFLSGRNTGVLIATGLGSHGATFDYKDSLITYGEKEPSPIKFSHSVHNSTASYVSNLFNLNGPCLTVSNFDRSFENAFLIASNWLELQTCKYVLLGVLDEYCDVLGYIINNMLSWSFDGKVNPFMKNELSHVPGEGAVFFLLEKSKHAKYGFLSLNKVDNEKASDVSILSQMNPDKKTFPENSENRWICDFSPSTGYYMTMNAMQCAIGALMLQKQIVFPLPSTEKDFDVLLPEKLIHQKLKQIRLVHYCYDSEVINMDLNKNFN